MTPPGLATVALMHPTLVARPFHRAGWIYEEKVDGWRMVAYKVRGPSAAHQPTRPGEVVGTR